MKKLLFFALFLCNFVQLKAQIFSQDFSLSSTVADYVSATPNSGQFDGISVSTGNLTTSINEEALRFDRSNPSPATTSTSIVAYRNFLSTTSPKFVQFSFDFELSGTNALSKGNGAINIQLGSGFTASSGSYATRIGINTTANNGEYRISAVDVIGTLPQSVPLTGRSTVTVIVNNSGSGKSYNAPNGSIETIANQKMEFWVGTTRVANEFDIKTPTVDIDGFKISSAGTVNLYGILDFDDIEMTSLETVTTPPIVTVPPGGSTIHPRIWVNSSDRAKIISDIAQYTWAQNLYNQYVSRVNPKKIAHKADPSTILNTIPAFPGSRTKHLEILTLGFESSLLYWLTGDNDYGQLAADILNYYTTNIAGIAGSVNFDSSGSDAYLIDSRQSYTKPPMIYDFVYDFLIKSGTKVYDKNTGTMVSFDFSKSETAFKKLADQVFTRGSINSNHPVLEAPGALFNVLAIEDAATREAYFNKFMTGTANQNGLNWMINEIKTAGVWPEATGYSIGPHRIVLELMEVVDRYKPSLQIFDNNKDLLNNAFFFENYRFPNNKEVMRFGDAHRTSLNTEDLFERVLTTAKRKAYGNLENKSTEILKAIYTNKGGFNPTVSTQTLEWNNPLQLLWGVNVNLTNVTPITYNSSINIDYAGIAMQRNINTLDRVESGLMAYTGGAHYVHSHLSGIDMELYGLGAVLGTGGGDVGAGNNARDGDEFRNYHRIYAGHNTVIVNGTSKGRGAGAWKTDNQLFMNTTATVSAEPKSLENPISTQFSFSDQVLDDAINNAKQERVLSIIRTSDNTGYYLDLFRSKSLGTNNYHDYVYHNVGDEVQIFDNANTPIPLVAAPNRYPSTASLYNGSTILFPGWHYFEDINTSSPTISAIKATIPMTKQGIRYMHILMPGGENREYSACKGPATIEAQIGYAGLKTPVFTVRNFGEAWNKPFVSIFEPSRTVNGSVKTVENIYDNNKIVGAKVISEVDGQTITDYIIAQENNNTTYTNSSMNFSFTGRFGILRVIQKNGTNSVDMYIGEGANMSYGNRTLTADVNKKAYLGLQTLPVTIVNYTAKLTNEGSLLSWETVSETNNKNFIVSRSVDGSNFLDIAKIPANNKASKYQTIDSKPFAGTNYYKLVQVDLDGTQTQLGVKTVYYNLSNGKPVVLYPNPADRVVNLSFSTQLEENLRVDIYDLSGKLLQTALIPTLKNKNDYTLHLDKQVTTGIYLLKLNSKGVNCTERLMVK